MEADKKMTRQEFYAEQLERFRRGERWSGGGDCLRVWGQKPGRFAELLIAEVLGESLSTERRHCAIPNGAGGHYIADGWVADRGVYLESKFQAFGTSGTAHEKLPNFLIKAAGYDRPVLIVLGGEHEVSHDPTSRMLRFAWERPEECTTPSQKAMLALVETVRGRIAGIIGLSELEGWHRSTAATPPAP